MLQTFLIKLLSFIFVGSTIQEVKSLRYSSSSKLYSRRDPFLGNSSPENLYRDALDELIPGFPIHSLLFNHHRTQKDHKMQEVFPAREDVAENRSYLPDLGFLTDLAFLFIPRDFPASGMVRLSRDLFESEQCVQFVGCEMTRMSYTHGKYLSWVNEFLQDFPFQGDIADRLREGTIDTLKKLQKREESRKKRTLGMGNEERICSFSCSPIKSLSRGLKILSLLHDLVRTVKY